MFSKNMKPFLIWARVFLRTERWLCWAECIYTKEDGVPHLNARLQTTITGVMKRWLFLICDYRILSLFITFLATTIMFLWHCVALLSCIFIYIYIIPDSKLMHLYKHQDQMAPGLHHFFLALLQNRRTIWQVKLWDSSMEQNWTIVFASPKWWQNFQVLTKLPRQACAWHDSRWRTPSSVWPSGYYLPECTSACRQGIWHREALLSLHHISPFRWRFLVWIPQAKQLSLLVPISDPLCIILITVVLSDQSSGCHNHSQGMLIFLAGLTTAKLSFPRHGFIPWETPIFPTVSFFPVQVGIRRE